jgi:hypothetical protein
MSVNKHVKQRRSAGRAPRERFYGRAYTMVTPVAAIGALEHALETNPDFVPTRNVIKRLAGVATDFQRRREEAFAAGRRVTG